MNTPKRLSSVQKDKLSLALKKLDITTKCKLYHEAEQAVIEGYPCTQSEYVFDQLFINEDSPVYTGGN